MAGSPQRMVQTHIAPTLELPDFVPSVRHFYVGLQRKYVPKRRSVFLPKSPDKTFLSLLVGLAFIPSVNNFHSVLIAARADFKFVIVGTFAVYKRLLNGEIAQSSTAHEVV